MPKIDLEKDVRACLEESRLGPTNAFENALAVIELLWNAQCCSRCCLRFVDCPKNSLYLEPESDLDSVLVQLLKDRIQTRSAPIVCTACVGALQLVDQPTFSDSIKARLDSEGHESKCVSLGCTLPVSLLHRDRLLRIYVKDKLKISCGARDPKDLFRSMATHQLEDKIGLKVDASGALKMTIVLQHEPTSTEHHFLTQAKNPVLKLRKKQKRGKISTFGDSRTTIAEALNALSDEEARKLTSVPPAVQTEPATIEAIQLVHDSILLGGRYLKFSRGVSQSPWSVNGKKLAETSVSECVGETLKKHYRSDDYKLVPAGREDANVRMLGTGRPFYCELVNPRSVNFSQQDYLKMQEEINNLPTKESVQVRDLTLIDGSDTKIIKEGEQFKRKTYRALVWLSEPVTQEMLDRVNQAGSSPFKIQQNTPIRVFQRRSAAIREKEIHFCKLATPRNVGTAAAEQHFAVLTMTTQAGTYIKEFVHGDLGRTLPNLATLAGVQAADLIELDVIDVDLEWPPRRKSKN